MSDPVQPETDAIRRLFEVTVELMGVATAEGYLTQLNPAWERCLGWTRAELRSRPYLDFVHPDDREATSTQARALLDSGFPGARAFENRCRTRDGAYRCLQWTTVADDDLLYIVGLDVTGRRSSEKLERDDAVSLAHAITESVAEGLYVADADGRLTYINPVGLRSLGYASADELLGREVHATLHHTRWDGSPYPIAESPLLKVRCTRQPVHVSKDIFWRKDGSPVDVSYSSAPITLQGGTGNVVTFHDISAQQAASERARRRSRDVAWLGQVRSALREDRFALHGQPIIDVHTGAVVKHELLLRMVSPAGEIIGPGVFLPAAEKHGLVQEIDHWVITRAVELAAAGHAVAANLSAASIGSIETLVHIERELTRTGAGTDQLTFEVTETTLMHDLQAGRRFADRLVSLGCTFALDDFGTGYGSLTYLRRLPITFLKIDVQFVREMATSTEDQQLVEGIVHIARNLGKTTIAEGVEDEETLDLLRAYGVDLAQGFHLGRPEPFDLADAEPAREGSAA